jgi:hypothetical protein
MSNTEKRYSNGAPDLIAHLHDCNARKSKLTRERIGYMSSPPLTEMTAPVT